MRGSESAKGYVLSADTTKLWLRSYASNLFEFEDEEDDAARYHNTFTDDMELEIPALERRFM
ncbi:hypothetical protein DU506_12040 [Vreelandella rituensis]|uniref:Uncharacterized protein n=1 Tax=Vreelandella rituensis TaxID=2282306 RepID=A0A368TYY4_9GAMM|nr:hypothetical protein DU506_12040 [Halomonas rituensis]